MTRTDQLERLLELTRQMRSAQKLYFAPTTRSQTTLNASKQAESDVDKLLASLDSPQTDLFEAKP